MLVELHAWLTCRASEVEVVLGTREHRQGSFVVLKFILSRSCVLDCNFNRGTFLHGSIFGCDRYVLVNNALPHEVKVELTVIGQLNLFGLDFIDEDFAEVQLSGLR